MLQGRITADTPGGAGTPEQARSSRGISFLWSQLAGRWELSGPVTRMRLAFLAFSVLSLVALTPMLARDALDGSRLGAAALGLGLLLAVKWVWEHEHMPPHVLADTAEGLALVVVGLALQSPLLLLILLFARISYRALDASAARSGLLMAGYIAAFLAPALVPGNHLSASRLELAFLSTGFPLAALVMHLLGVSLLRLAASTDRETVLQHVAEVIALVDDDGVVQYASPAVRSVFGVEPADVTGRNANDMLHPDDAERVRAALRGACASQTSTVVEARLAHRDGKWRDVMLTASAAGTVRGGPGLVLTVRDVTEQRRTQAALAHSEAGFRLLFDRHPHPMWVYDAQTLRFLAVNDAAVTRYGYTRAEFATMTIVHIRPAADVPLLLDDLAGNREALQSGAVWRHQLKNGRVIDVEISSHSLEFAGRDAVLVLAQDITSRTALEAQLRHRADHDPLTDLANRTLFAERVTTVLSRPGGTAACAVLIVDLDDFKIVNSTLGRHAGDELLMVAAARLDATLRSSDTAARLGGDEFAILLDGVSEPSEAVEVAERLAELLRAPVQLPARDLLISCSIGVAISGPAIADCDTLLRCADMAMRAAKSDGKGRVRVYQARMGDQVLDRMALEEDIRMAVSRGELRLVYQPQVHLQSGRISGVEALVRWDHPRRGAVPPDEFIGVAEQCGAIADIDAWVLREACAQARRWRDQGLPRLRMGVNLSGRELDGESLSDRVTECLAETGLHPDDLEFEITESAAVAQEEVALHALDSLRERGVRVAIDDFGTGYSALGRLRSYPVDRIKIDKSFVQEIGDGTERAPLVAAMIVMAHSLGLEVVAEGVETPNQLALLARHGCDTVQGYLTCRPLPPEQITVMLRDARLENALAELLQQRPQTVDAILELVSGEVGFDELAATLLDDVLQRLDSVAVSVAVIDWQSGSMRVVASRGAQQLPGDTAQQMIPLVAPDGTLVGEMRVISRSGAGNDDLAQPLLRLYARVLAATLLRPGGTDIVGASSRSTRRPNVNDAATADS